MNSELVIAHISDLHFPHWDNGTFLNLKNFLKGKKPDVIIVTGDLADQPWPASHRDVKAKLVELKQACDAIETGRNTQLVVIPGNHDYALWGNWNFGSSPLWRISFGHYFQGYKKDYFEILTDQLNIFFFCFNSNPFVARWAKGVISRRQLKSFQRKVDELRGKYGEKFDSGYKVAVLHHHPLPVPHSEQMERFLILKNAGEVLRLFAQTRINLVLHGHKHDSVISSVNLGTAYAANLGTNFSATRKMFVVASGSTLKNDERENSCNVITIRKSAQVEVIPVSSWRGDEFREKEAVLLPSWEDYIKERYLAEKMRLGYEIDEFRKDLVIDDEGDGLTHTQIKGLRVINQGNYKKLKDTEIDPFELQTEMGKIALLKVRSSAEVRPQTHHTRRDPKRNNVVNGILGLPDDVTPDQRLEIGFRYRTLNAWALNEEEFRQKYHNKLDSEPYEEEWIVPNRPVKVFNLTIHLPRKKCKPQRKPELLIFAPTAANLAKHQEVELEKFYAPHLIYNRRANTITVVLEKPLLKYKYVVRWTLPATSASNVNPKYLEEAKELIARLPKHRDQIETTLHAAEVLIRESLPLPPRQVVDTALAFPFAETNNNPKLRVIADNQGVSPVENKQLEIGDGIPGRTYKLNEVYLYTEQEGVRDNPKPVYEPFGRVHQHKVLYSIPLQHPMEPNLVIGVFTIGSQDGYSDLIPADDETEEQMTARIVDIAQTFIVYRLRSIGGDILSIPKTEPKATEIARGADATNPHSNGTKSAPVETEPNSADTEPKTEEK